MYAIEDHVVDLKVKIDSPYSKNCYTLILLFLSLYVGFAIS